MSTLTLSIGEMKKTFLGRWKSVVRPDVLTRVMQRLYRVRTITIESHVS